MCTEPSFTLETREDGRTALFQWPKLEDVRTEVVELFLFRWENQPASPEKEEED